MLGWILAAAVALLLLWLAFTFNAFVRLRNRVREAFSGIDVQLKRRRDLVPNLVSTVKGYASHEQETLDAVIQARSRADAGGAPAEVAEHEGALSQALGRLFALAEAYPDLKANQNFLALQDQIEGTENRLAVERRQYNELARRYNARIQKFPSNIVADMIGFESKPYFEAESPALESLEDPFDRDGG